MSCTLFRDEIHTDTKAMLKDLLTLYCLHYGVNIKEGAQILRVDLRDWVKERTEVVGRKTGYIIHDNRWQQTGV